MVIVLQKNCSGRFCYSGLGSLYLVLRQTYKYYTPITYQFMYDNFLLQTKDHTSCAAAQSPKVKTETFPTSLHRRKRRRSLFGMLSWRRSSPQQLSHPVRCQTRLVALHTPATHILSFYFAFYKYWYFKILVVRKILVSTFTNIAFEFHVY